MGDREDMDEGQEALRGVIKTLARLVNLADRKANQLCKEGRNTASANIGAIEIALMRAHTETKAAYRLARGIDVPVDGEIVPFGGGT